MTDAAPEQELFDEMINARGGLERMSPLNIEVATICARLMLALRTADTGDIVKISATIASLQSQLPPPVAAERASYGDMSRLTDEQFAQFDQLCKISRGEANAVLEPVYVEPELGRAEIAGRKIGRWLDELEQRDSLAHRSPTELEANELRNGLQAICGASVIARNLWRSIYQADLEDQIERAVKAALSAVGSDAEIVEPLPNEPKKLPSIHDGGYTTMSNYDFLNGRFDNKV